MKSASEQNKAVADKTKDAASKISRTTKRLIKQAIDMIRRRDLLH